MVIMEQTRQVHSLHSREFWLKIIHLWVTSIIHYFLATVVKLKYYLDSIIPHWQVIYHTSTTPVHNFILGRLSVELLKGSHFRNLTTQKAPDTFVTLTLLDGNCKVKWSHPDLTPISPQPPNLPAFHPHPSLPWLHVGRPHPLMKISPSPWLHPNFTPFLGSDTFKINYSKISTKSSLQRIILFSSGPFTAHRYYSSYFSIF